MRIGIDLGGTKIELMALDAAGQPCYRERIPTPQGNYPATVQAIVSLVLACERSLASRATVGIGIPGTESPASGLIKNANSTCLIGQPLRADLQQALQREIRLANDANCFALSEAVDGAGQDYGVVFGVILGTGVGGGIVVDQRLLVGPGAIAGEWGHNPLPSPSQEDQPLPTCYCGRRGCIETFLCGPALTRQYHAFSDKTLSPTAIAAAAEAGDPLAENCLRRYEARLGRALATVINVLDPDAIVLGGGLSRLQRLYRNLPADCAPHVFTDQFATPILPPRHGDASGVRGAAWLWP